MSRVQYSPYGSIISTTGSLPTDRLFTGQRWEARIELYDYRARFYDPLVGSFISADAVVPETGNPRAWNRFAYVYNNPLKYTDPSGYCAEFGDDACWGLYDRIKQECPECNTIVTGNGIVPLHEANYNRLRIYRRDRIVNPVDYEIPPALEAFHIMTTEQPDALVLGANLSAISPQSGTQGPTIGVEAVINGLDDTSIFGYDGVVTGPGIGLSYSPYIGAVWDLENNLNYRGDFESLSSTFALGEGFSVTAFWAPNFTANKPFGVTVGPAAGFEASVIHSRTFYREILTNRR